jgi:hypothetical protein
MAAFLLALAPIWSAIKSGSAALWAFAARPPGLYVALVVLALLAIWGSGELGYRRGDSQGRADCEARHAQAIAAERARQARVSASVTAASDVRTAASKAQDSQNREIVADVKARANNQPPPPSICPPAVPAALADRVRRLE